MCGASPVASTLARLAAAMNYPVVLAAPAEDLRHLGAEGTRHEGYDLAELDLAPRDFVVVATQGRRDREALGAALRSAADYVAFVGSRRKAAWLRERLDPDDLGEARLDRLHAPAGLAINAIDPSEIALSIMAEIVATRRRSQRDDLQMSEIYQLFGGEDGIDIYLTLSATTKDSDLNEITSRFSEIPLGGLVFTKLDESTVFGPIFNHAIRFKTPIAYLTTGQKVPEDIETATKERLVDLLLNISGN